MKYLLISALWIGYCSLHSYLISIRFTNLMTRLLKNYYAFYRLFFILISCFLLILLINFTTQLDNEVIIFYAGPLNVVRQILAYTSLTMFFWAFFFNYDSLSFFGIRQILNAMKRNKMNSKNEVKKRGLLGIVRHPMYLALIIFLWCETFSMADIIVYTILTVYIIIGTILEEKKLVLEFGNAYVEYQKKVPMLIPFAIRKVK